VQILTTGPSLNVLPPSPLLTALERGSFFDSFSPCELTALPSLSRSFLCSARLGILFFSCKVWYSRLSKKLLLPPTQTIQRYLLQRSSAVHLGGIANGLVLPIAPFVNDERSPISFPNQKVFCPRVEFAFRHSGAFLPAKLFLPLFPILSRQKFSFKPSTPPVPGVCPNRGVCVLYGPDRRPHGTDFLLPRSFFRRQR